MLPIALIPGKHEMLLSKFKEEVGRDPDADFTSSIQTVAAEFRKMETEREQGVINTLFLNLYALDAHSLRRDLSKLAILGTAKATPSQRTALLRCLYGVLSLYIQDDFSAVTSMCEQVEDAYRMEDGSPELDTWG